MFTCNEGYTTDANPEGTNLVEVTCNAAGEAEFPVHTHETWPEFLENGGCRRWATSEWQACDTACGQGHKRRTAICEPVADTCVNPPEVEEACTSYTDCPDCGDVPDLSAKHAYRSYMSSDEREVPKLITNGLAHYYDCDHHNGYTLDGGSSTAVAKTSFFVQCRKEDDRQPLPSVEFHRYSEPSLMSKEEASKLCRRWEITTWSPCQAGGKDIKCGSGYNFREVRCSTGSDADCANEARPSITLSRPCSMICEEQGDTRGGAQEFARPALFVLASMIAPFAAPWAV